MRQHRWLELLSDYDCEILYHSGKENVVADALSRKERIKPLRVRALVMNIGLDLPKQILNAQTKARKPENIKNEDVGVGDRVMLKVSPWKGVVCFGKHEKLNHRYVGPFKVLEKVGAVAYKLELPQELSRVHNTFHVSNLKKCYADEPLAVPLDGLHIDDKLHFVEEPVEIIDQNVNASPIKKVVEGVETIIAPATAEEKAKRSSEELDQTFDRLQKLISQLEIHGESISQEDVRILQISHENGQNRTNTDTGMERVFKSRKFDSKKCMRTRNSYFPNNSNVTIPRRQNKGRAPNIVEPELRTIVAPMAERTMEELLRAPTEGITSTLRFRNVPNDVIKLMMFPYSLEGAAKTWYEKEPPNSILTWEDLVTKFVNQFFPPSKTTHLKNEISRFTQKFEETFSEAWERFKELLRACPHHGFTELTQVDTFYNGLNENEQDSLNAAAGGNLLSKMTREALNIIENKSKVRYSRNRSNVSRMNATSSKTDERNDKLADQLSTLVEIVSMKVVTPAPVKAVEESCVTCGGAHSCNFSVEEIIPIPRESEDTSRSDSENVLPLCDDLSSINAPRDDSVTFSNPLFKFDVNFNSSSINPLFDEVLEEIECKDFYDSNLDESTFLVTPLSDSNKDECLALGDDIEILLHHDPSIPMKSVASILEGFIDEPPFEENDDLFDLECKTNDWKRILYDAQIGDNDKIGAFLAIEVPTYIEEGYYDSERDVIYLESLLSDDTTHNLSPEVFFDHEPKHDTFSPKSDPLHHEFTGELITIPPGIVREHEDYINRMSLLCGNSSSRSSENSHTIIESLPTSTTLVEDSDSNREEIDIFSGPDDSIPPGIESDFDSEEDIIDNLLNDDPIPEYERLTFDMEPDVHVINNVNEDECFDPGGGEINVEVDNSFTFVTRTFLSYLTYPKVSPLLSSTENEDTIFDPGIST
ncbi:reverse transcriptase domain-containing protein [Tanacetum coccineum]|uniref:Reverse transcriptase domain-containing protein n=1 Tax=Tanacetum coccineum TaxID=301880 RepID=A0ABQ4XAL4_9ASTR